MSRVPTYWLDDVAQQVVGAFLLSGPFVVTEEVWRLAGHMAAWQVGAAVALVGIIGYLALYEAYSDRPIEMEEAVLGVPLRFMALMLISYGAVTLLLTLFSAPATFGVTTWTTVRAVSIAAIFAVVGAATADSLF